MAPIWLSWLASLPAAQLFARQSNDAPTSWSSVATNLAAQWRYPNDVLTVLLLGGPDVIQGAIVQLAGRTITLVAVWLGGLCSGCTAFQLWSLEDSMKDEQPHIAHFESNGEPQEPPTRMEKGKEMYEQAQGPRFEALRVTVFKLEDGVDPEDRGVPRLDLIWFLGVLTIVLQLAIAAIPFGINGQWDIFLVTAAGNLFAVVTGSLLQWRSEKWACPKKGGQTVAITEGNGSRSAIVIEGEPGKGLDLNILARGTHTAEASMFTRLANSVLAMLWIMLLITVQAITQRTWYLLGIGLLGSIQNIVAASIRRSPGALGIHIKKHKTFSGSRVAEVLKNVEKHYPLVGTALLDVFFPGSMRVRRDNTDNIAFWRSALPIIVPE